MKFTYITGVEALSKEESTLPKNCYIRCVDKVEVGAGRIRIIIRMAPIMSRYLLEAKWLTVDTSFKSIQSWEEFEVETCHNNAKQCECLS